MTRLDDLFAVSEPPAPKPDLAAQLRAAPAFIPACPLCSIVGQPDMPDAIRYPTAIVRRTDGRHGLIRCCPASENCPWFETAAEAASWWAVQRQKGLSCLATENRRRNVLAKLAAAGHEPITTETQ